MPTYSLSPDVPAQAAAIEAAGADGCGAGGSASRLLQRGLTHVVELSVQALGAQAAQIVWKGGGAPLVAGPKSARLAARHPLAGRVLQFGETVVEQGAAAAVALSASHWMRAVGVPLRTHDGAVRAALCLAYRHATAWGEREQRLLDTLAADAAAHLEQHAAAEGIRAFYERTLNAMPAQLALFDLEARFTYVGRNAVRDPETRAWLVGRTDLDYARHRGMDEALALRRMAVIRRVARQGRPIQFEETLRSGAQEHHFIRFITPVVDEDGRTVQVLAYGLDITDRRRAELKLERFRTMLDHAEEAIFLLQAESGRFVDVNDGASRMLGYDREELLGLALPDVEVDSALADAAAWRRHVERVGAAEAPVTFESTYRRKDGTPFPTELSITRETFEGRDYLLGLVRDVTERRQAEEALRRSEHRYRNLIEQASDAIFVGTRASGYVEVNSEACTLTGFTREQLLEMRPEDLIVAASDDEVPVPWHALEAGRTHRAERVMRRSDGTLIPVELNATLADDGLVLAIVRDVTQRKRYEEGLIAAKERAEEMSRIKSVFLANMSHEFRTPLAGIIGFADVLVDEGEEHVREFAQAIHQNGQRLLDTLNAVLELAQLEGDTLELEPVPMDVRPVLADVVGRYRAQTGERGLVLDLDLPEEPLTACVDAAALDRVLDALLANAVKFTDEGGIAVRAAEGHDAVVLSVADTGIGIDPGFVAHVFEEFRQESSGDTRAYEGSGLGLTLADRLLALMDGTIEVDSELGAGSTFTVRLPRGG